MRSVVFCAKICFAVFELLYTKIERVGIINSKDVLDSLQLTCRVRDKKRRQNNISVHQSVQKNKKKKKKIEIEV